MNAAEIVLFGFPFTGSRASSIFRLLLHLTAQCA